MFGVGAAGRGGEVRGGHWIPFHWAVLFFWFVVDRGNGAVLSTLEELGFVPWGFACEQMNCIQPSQLGRTLALLSLSCGCIVNLVWWPLKGRSGVAGEKRRALLCQGCTVRLQDVTSYVAGTVLKECFGTD